MSEGTTPRLKHDARVHMLASRLLMGDPAAPPAAWQLRRDLVERTWAWPVAQRLLERPRPTPGSQT
jgi:hypothetical protein